MGSDAPWLIDTPLISDPVPCMKSYLAKLWQYSFPAAQDKNVDSLSIQLSCPSLQGVFVTSTS